MRGRVLNCAEGGVLVLPEAEAPVCGGCRASCRPGPCPDGQCPDRPPGHPVLAKVQEEAEFSPGQIVKLRRGGLVSQTAAALLPPAAGFILGYVLAGLSAGENRAGAGLIGMFVFALGVYLFRRRRQPRLYFTIKPRETAAG
ncbi:MAG: SoxR reducing system RseC family protein, partial [Treponema sp.]|nr:SoxR reducing system RseC family protein [Treponema sp.]